MIFAHRSIWLLLPCLAIAAMSLNPANAKTDYPKAKPISLVVPFPAGGGVDTVGRIIADQLAKDTNANIVIENKGGAGGTIGVGYVARAKPDGYTLTMGSPGNISIGPSIYSNLSYQPAKDLQPIAMGVLMPLLLVSRLDAPFKNVQELIAYGKANPGKLTYGSGGTGTSQHLAGAMFAKMAGINAVHVPYKGSSPMLIDLMAGRIDYTFIDTSAIPNVKSGKLKLLAVTSAKRSKLLPDTPTVAESGVADFEATNWYGFFAPAGTSPDIAKWLNQHIVKTLSEQNIIEKFNSQSMEPAPNMSVQAFSDFLKKDTEKWSALVKSMDLKLD